MQGSAGKGRWSFTTVFTGLSVRGVLLALIPCLATVARCDELDEAAVATLVEAWVAPNATDAARTEAMSKLRRCDPVKSQKTVRRLIADPARRSATLDLAAELCVPGLFATVKPLIDSSDEERVVRLLLRTDDPAAQTFLLDRWRKAEVGSASYEYVVRGLLENGLSATTEITRLKAHLAAVADPRRADACSVLAFQMSAPAETTPETLLASWDVLYREYDRDAKRQPRTGASLMSLVGSGSTGVRRLGPNISVAPGGQLVLGPLPEELQKGNWRIVGWVRVFSEDGTAAKIVMNDQQVWAIRTTKGEWIVKEEFGSEKVRKVEAGEWTAIEFRWVDESEAGERYARTVQASVAGERLLDRGKLNGLLTSVAFSAGPTQRIVVGGVEYARAAK